MAKKVWCTYDKSRAEKHIKPIEGWPRQYKDFKNNQLQMNTSRLKNKQVEDKQSQTSHLEFEDEKLDNKQLHLSHLEALDKKDKTIVINTSESKNHRVEMDQLPNLRSKTSNHDHENRFYSKVIGVSKTVIKLTCYAILFAIIMFITSGPDDTRRAPGITHKQWPSTKDALRGSLTQWTSDELTRSVYDIVQITENEVIDDKKKIEKLRAPGMKNPGSTKEAVGDLPFRTLEKYIYSNTSPNKYGRQQTKEDGSEHQSTYFLDILKQSQLQSPVLMPPQIEDKKAQLYRSETRSTQIKIEQAGLSSQELKNNRPIGALLLVNSALPESWRISEFIWLIRD